MNAANSEPRAPRSDPLTAHPAWQALVAHQADIGRTHLRDLFADDPERGTTFTSEAAGWFLDYSKNRVTARTLELLTALANLCGLRERTAAMFCGEAINTTEQRAVLHVALRAPVGQQIMVDGRDVVAEVHAVLARMAAFAEDVRGGRWLGHTGKRIRNIVNIGIGGSDLGPVMAYRALRSHADQVHVRFKVGS